MATVTMDQLQALLGQPPRKDPLAHAIQHWIATARRRYAAGIRD